eukprot:365483-Chlamydomonas_euryale.AAC.9
MPKTTSSTVPASSPTGMLDVRASGTREHTTPICTEMSVMSASDATEPTNETALPSLSASSAAMKNVLSPISERKMSENAARNPDVPSGPLTRLDLSTGPTDVCMTA